MSASPATCLYCRSSLGALRKLRGQRFCCRDHRIKYYQSARAQREAEDLYGFDETNGTSWREVTAVRPEDKSERKAGMASLIFVGMAALVAVVAFSQFPGRSAAPRAAVSALPDTGLHPTQSGFGHLISNLIESKASGTLRDDFHSGISGWEGLKAARLDWGFSGGEVRPASLKLWKPSTALSNYELEFMGHIDRKSMDWAFRAPDLHNYYGAKLEMTRPGPLPNAGLVRFVVLDGRERERVELPLPLTLERGVDYRIRVSVRGNRFLTSVNGQLISSWMDNRISRGGVGFFSEDGESSVLKWVSLSERDSFLARMASHFSLLAVPGAPITPLN